MRHKPRPVCGISISPYYLDADLLAVSFMTVNRHKEGGLQWWTLPGVKTFSNHAEGWAWATAVCKQLKVKAYVGYARGRVVSITEYERLERRGLLAHLL